MEEIDKLETKLGEIESSTNHLWEILGESEFKEPAFTKIESLLGNKPWKNEIKFVIRTGVKGSGKKYRKIFVDRMNVIGIPLDRIDETTWRTSNGKNIGIAFASFDEEKNHGGLVFVTKFISP